MTVNDIISFLSAFNLLSAIQIAVLSAVVIWIVHRFLDR